MAAIEFQDVSKTFSRHQNQLLLRSHMARWARAKPKETFYALHGISFRAEHGESVAVIGSNGAGKSTLLGLVAGLAKPNAGSVRVNGRVAALLELGSGFHSDLTGAENIRMNAALLGLSRGRTRELFDEIVEFSGVGRFIDEPLRTYSSGMVVRLAFSVAVNTDPDILLVDEVLVVGDQEFQAKCYAKIADFRRAGKTLLFVSHATAILEHVCDTAIWLDQGKLIMSGGVRDVIEMYTGKTTAQV